MEPVFFPDAASLRRWFERYGSTRSEVWIAYYKRGSGRRSVSYDEAVEEALCFGWIDGQVRRLDEVSYANRYTPRGPRSPWSALNLDRARRLIRTGRMAADGRRAFVGRDRARERSYSYERAIVTLSPELRAELSRATAAYAFHRQQSPSYRRACAHWVMSAK